MKITLLIVIPIIIILFFTLIILIIRALLKYPKSKDVRKEKSELRVTLGESRQAVSKWGNWGSDPRTSNLFAIANLY